MPTIRVSVDRRSAGDPPPVNPRRTMRTDARGGEMSSSASPRAAAPSPLSSIGKSLTKAFERMSTAIDDTVRGDAPWPTLCSSPPSPRPTTAGAERGVVGRGASTDGAAAPVGGAGKGAEATSVDARIGIKPVAGDARKEEPSAPRSPVDVTADLDAATHLNFASWLSSQEFDASAIVWNGDDDDPRDVPRYSPDQFPKEVVEEEEEEEAAAVEAAATAAAAAAEDSGYLSIRGLRTAGVGGKERAKEGNGDGRFSCTHSPLTLHPLAVVGDALDGMLSSNWKCWDADDLKSETPRQACGRAESAGARRTSLGGGGGEEPTLTKIRKDSSWAFDQLGVSPRRDRARWGANNPIVVGDPHDGVPAERESSGGPGNEECETSSSDGAWKVGVGGAELSALPFEMRALQPTRTRTNDLSVATPLAGEDISVCDRKEPNAGLPAVPHRAIASADEDRTVVTSNSCTYSISPPRQMPPPPRQVTVVARPAPGGAAPPTAPAVRPPPTSSAAAARTARGGAGPTAASADASETGAYQEDVPVPSGDEADDECPLMCEYFNRRAGGGRQSKHRRYFTKRMRRRTLLTTSK